MDGSVLMPRRSDLVPVSQLHASKRNPRVHSAEKIRQLADMVLRFGWTVPIIVDQDWVVLAGHARLEAAKLLGLTQVPVIQVRHLSPEQRRAYVIADNRITESSGWDERMLAEELRALEATDCGLEGAGFTAAALEDLERALRLEGMAAPADMGLPPGGGAPVGYGDPANAEAAAGAGQGEAAGRDMLLMQAVVDAAVDETEAEKQHSTTGKWTDEQLTDLQRARAGRARAVAVYLTSGGR